MRGPWLSAVMVGIVGGVMAIALLCLFAWTQHMFVTGLNPYLGTLFALLGALVVILLAISFFRRLTKRWLVRLQFTPALLFAIGAVSLIVSGVLKSVFMGNAAADIHLHDTYLVLGSVQLGILLACIFGLFACIFQGYPKVFGRYMNVILGKIHFWITLVCVYLLFWPMHYEAPAAMPRRYMDTSNLTTLNVYNEQNRFISTVAIIFVAAQVLFVFNFFLSLFNGRRLQASV